MATRFATTAPQAPLTLEEAMEIFEDQDDEAYICDKLRLHEACHTNVRMDNFPDSAQIIVNLSYTAHRWWLPIRMKYNFPMVPNSMYRNTAVNKAVGGAEFSGHRWGLAVDQSVPGVSTQDLAVWVQETLCQEPFDQVILEDVVKGKPGMGWVHMADGAVYPPGLPPKTGGQNRNEYLTKFKGEVDANGKAVYHKGFILI